MSMDFNDKDIEFVFSYLTERIEMSVSGELLEVEMLHGADKLPAGRAFTDAEKQFVMLGALYGARHLVQMQLTDGDVNAAVRRGVTLITGRDV